MNDQSSPKLVYRIAELVAATGIPRSKIYEDIRAGKLRTWKLGARTMISADAVREWLTQLEIEGTEK